MVTARIKKALIYRMNACTTNMHVARPNWKAEVDLYFGSDIEMTVKVSVCARGKGEVGVGGGDCVGWTLIASKIQ